MCDLLEDLFSLESDFSPDRDKQAHGLSMLLRFQGRGAMIVIATNGDSIIGMGTVQLMVSTAEGRVAGLVEDVIVRKEYRRTGLGTKILSRIEQWCGERKVARLHLLADRDNSSALNFYSRRSWSSTKLICLRKYL